MSTDSRNLFSGALACLRTEAIDSKLIAVRELAQNWHLGRLNITPAAVVYDVTSPGMPENLQLVQPSAVERRRLGSPQGRIALLHAVAHIEFSAINLALDAIYRFQSMPRSYYADWIRISCEECYHFSLLRKQLQNMGSDYGALVAHQGLWDVAQYSASDVLQRMALVPRVLEARGLDVTPGMIKRVRKAGADQFADILKIILRDEVGHVAAGSHWFNWICAQRKLDSAQAFDDIISQYKSDTNAHIKGPFEEEIRLAAGFSLSELEILNRQSGRPLNRMETQL